MASRLLASMFDAPADRPDVTRITGSRPECAPSLPARPSPVPSRTYNPNVPERAPDVTPEIVRGDLTDEQLQLYLRSPEIAVDTETLGLHPLRDRLCVVQVCDRAGRAVLVQVP